MSAKELASRIRKASTLEYTSILTDSKFMGCDDQVSTPVPMINLALSGSVHGGIQPGILQITGQSKHFKSNIALMLCSSYLKAKPNAVMVFLDSEFGSKKSYFESAGINPDRVVHVPITNIEELTFETMKLLEVFGTDDEIIFMVDSVGNLASKREVENALKENTAQDMTRAKTLKAFGRQITPLLTLKSFPYIIINHIYMTQETYSKPVVSGGTGLYLSSDDIWIIGRQQEKDGKDLIGWNFIINIEKSRTLKEKEKIPLVVTYDRGMSRWSGLLENAIEAGFIIQSGAWYQVVDLGTGEVSEKKRRGKDIMNDDSIWKALINYEPFTDFLTKKYVLPPLEQMEEDDDEVT